MEMQTFLDFTRSAMNDHGLHHWVIRIDRARKRLGQCDHNKKQLSFSREYIELGSQENILKTVLHEIAHALVGPNHGHDKVWANKCAEIGYPNPTRCTASDHIKQLDFKIVLVCESCGHEFGRQRQLKHHISNYRCGKCSSRLRYK